MQIRQQKSCSGFMLMESLLAFSIFGIAVTSIVLAIYQTAQLSQDVAREQWMNQQAQNIMKEVITAPRDGNDFAREVDFVIDSTTEARVLVEPLEATDQDGNLLEQMYTITVTIFWDNDGRQSQQSFSQIHYDNMFRSVTR